MQKYLSIASECQGFLFISVMNNKPRITVHRQNIDQMGGLFMYKVLLSESVRGLDLILKEWVYTPEHFCTSFSYCFLQSASMLGISGSLDETHNTFVTIAFWQHQTWWVLMSNWASYFPVKGSRKPNKFYYKLKFQSYRQRCMT